jgi:hypothetical protein
VTARAKAKPFAKAAMKTFENCCKDIAAPIADPAPAKTKNKVPINSTNDLLKRLAWFEEELLDPILYQIIIHIKIYLGVQSSFNLKNQVYCEDFFKGN